MIFWLLFMLQTPQPAPTCQRQVEWFLVTHGRTAEFVRPWGYTAHWHAATKRCYIQVDEVTDGHYTKATLFDMLTNHRIATATYLDDHLDAVDDGTTDPPEARVHRFIALMQD